jgi:hypothetical protein
MIRCNTRFWGNDIERRLLCCMQVIRGFQSAAAEMWMLGLTDYQVITTHSGYGRLGSFMSGKYHQVSSVMLLLPTKHVPYLLSSSVRMGEYV